MNIESETALVEKALEIEQRGDVKSLALARAMRGVLLPLGQHMECEVKERWRRNPEAMAASIDATAHVIGCFLASLAQTAGQRENASDREKLLHLILNGTLESALRAGNSDEGEAA